MKNKLGKIVELLIDWDDEQFEDLGVDIMSLVEKPAIGISWQAFADQFALRENGECPDGFEHQMPDGSWMCGREHEHECVDCFDLDEACWPGWEAIGMKNKNGKKVPNCVPIENSHLHFESYNDYPESAKNNAQRALDWAEEHGWGSCGEGGIGKRRANQLAKGENISEDTIARMASFARHKKNSETPYSEGCGKLMWDAWGGTSGIEWASNKLKTIREEQSSEEWDPIIAMASQPGFGEVFDITHTTEINGFQTEFSTLTDTLKAIIGLDILGKKDPKEEGEIKYRYAGPSAQRTFCKSLLRLGKVYTKKEIQQLTGIFGQENYHTASDNNFFKYKAGNNCRHYWEQVRVFRDGRKTVVVSEGPVQGIAGESMESQPNGGRIKMSEWNFSDDEQMVLTGPAMTPNVLIPRKDKDGNVFHVYFSEETIEKIARKFLEENKQHNTDINHDDDVVQENTLLESWIVSDPDMDKSKAMGFDVPKNTWMVSYKINNKETWDKIKKGELNGFSITGNFIEKATKK